VNFKIRRKLTGMEGHDASPEVAGVERYVDTRQGDGSKPTLQLDVSFRFLLTLCLLKARLDDITQHLLDLLDGVGLSQLYRGYQIRFSLRTMQIFDVP
jgi:hypothetical protein